MTTTILYNRLNADAVIAAAIAAKHIGDCKVADINKSIKLDADCYYWIGIEPKEEAGTVYSATRDKEHVFVYVDNFSKAGKKIKPKFEKVLDIDIEIPQECVKPSLIERISEKLDVVEQYQKIGFMIKRFYAKDATFEELTTVYSAILAAEMALSSRMPFEQPVIGSGSYHRYMTDIKAAKKDLEESYSTTTIADRGVNKSICYTCYSGSDIHLAMRLIRLSHLWFVNINMGINGPCVYSNLDDISQFELQKGMNILR